MNEGKTFAIITGVCEKVVQKKRKHVSRIEREK